MFGIARALVSRATTIVIDGLIFRKDIANVIENLRKDKTLVQILLI
jgi:ABC-type branched-subunit amino acid transport system ATPase component